MSLPDGNVEIDLLQMGVEGHLEAVPHQASEGMIGGVALPLATVPVGLPPVLPDMKDKLEEFLIHPERLPIHDTERQQQFLPRKMDSDSLYSVDVCPVQTTLVVDRNPTTGKLLGFKEEFVTDIGTSSKNSTSLKRPPGPPDEGVKGSSTNYPFWPGGLEEPNFEDLKAGRTEQKNSIDLDGDLLCTPPGFAKGMDFPTDKKLETFFKSDSGSNVLHLTDIFAQGDEIDFGGESGDEKEEEEEEKTAGEEKTMSDAESTANTVIIDDIIKLESRSGMDDQGPISLQEKKETYAVKVDINTPVGDFHKRIPDMAYKWPFELDVFQKQAVLHLESHDNVFVAAHTSAGKTVVAEYAIALSLRHMTRTVYTSPIKALSNQKFRDFKLTFGDVGLITGDVQIHPEAACLIMTTEILRSMLYNGSDVIRDLEWVIFDEVHYINDAERGVVWEEVLIMLPQHVNIILLSATVPNTLEFADWIGRTKKKKVYVVSTQKRPVPLEHYLYTGNSNKTSNELFLIVDKDKNFLTQGYSKAVDAKKERASKSSQNFGAKGQRGGNPAQDKNVWLSIIDMLKKKDKMPVVAFTFSKKRIEENANHLRSIDLSSASEKSEVHIFFQKCISRLKGTDKELPQVQQMHDLLKRGIGIHHSGVLPILKEVVELLFQKGLVKILFATETFAMGVNMPARTVVFDTIRKHDGTNFRDLLPGEYIQMAGRAGRRGLDTTGTVMILCKGDVPEMADLHKMMLGKPTLLESRFRLTYTMILNLLRVEQLRVEDMMKRSFSEFHNQKDLAKQKQSLETLTKKIGDMPEVLDYSGDLEDYYKTCDEYWTLKTELQKVVLSHPQAIKALAPGRVVVLDKPPYKNTLAVVLLSGSATSKERTFTLLAMCEANKGASLYDNKATDKSSAENGSEDSDSSLLPKPFQPQALFHPEGACGQDLVQAKAEHISAITTKVLKINADRIIDNCKKRQMPRFRNDPVGQSTSLATQELLRLVEANPTGLSTIDPVKDLHLRDVDLVEQFRRLQFLEEAFDNFVCVHDANFAENFKQVRANMKLKKEYSDLKFRLSDESLHLLPEYQQRIQVLQALKYIDEAKTVQLKGRVACEISNHELIITELVFENALTSLHPTEIAALLSCVVFEQKRCSEPDLCPDLVKARENFLDIATRIGQLQRDYGLPIPVEDYVECFHFGLMEVVFEWARGMPFADITNLTDVQEGIIVRCIQRLDEVLKDVRNAARIIGDPILYQKMEDASTMIKRDIVFAASLYTQ